MPRLRCCATKYAPDLLVSFLVVNSIRHTITSVNPVSGRLRASMEQNTLTIVTAEETSWGMLWLIIWRSVSMSLV